MYNLPQEQQKLSRLVDWSREQEKYMDQLQNRNTITPEQGQKLAKWRRRFSRLRKEAEEQLQVFSLPNNPRSFPNQNHFLFQKAQQLHHRFTRFLPKVQQRPQISSVSSTHNNMTHTEMDGQEQAVPIGEHTLPPLPYDYNALEPYIDEKTMRLHHNKHHKSYVEGLNKAEKEMLRARETGDYDLIQHWEREAAFNGAGHYLHTIFWNVMSPQGGGKPKGAIAKEIKQTFGSFEKFKAHFSAAAEQVEGSGWAMLVWAPRAQRVEILQAEKHQNLSQQDMIPLLVLDVWEHAYYLKYQNNRKAYIENWWNVVDWETVNRRFLEARQVRWKPY